MSNQSVVIKSNKQGLIVVLDEKTDWGTLKRDVAEKFRTSAKFFGNPQVALCFQGRRLTFEEEQEILKGLKRFPSQETAEEKYRQYEELGFCEP